MSGTRSGTRDSGRRRGAAPGGPRTRPGIAVALLFAAVFVALFYLWGRELLPGRAWRLGPLFPFAGAVALMLAVALFLTEWFRFADRDVRKVRLAARDFLFLSSLGLALLFLAKAVVLVLPTVPAWSGTVPPRAFVYLIPVTAFAMVVRVLLNAEVAILFTVAASVLSAAAVSGSWPVLLFLLLAGTAAASRSGRISTRSRMLRAGVLTAPVCAAGAVALELAFPGGAGAAWAGAAGAANGLLAAPVALAVMTVAELAFGYESDLRLTEMTATDHPLLRRLLLEAPGTFHHSVVVSTLAEAGAVAVGANPLLCRAAALYHDVGKLAGPRCYSENQNGADNVHDVLPPEESCALIRSHVAEGLRLARAHRLGERITRIIAQHHGDSLLYCFFDKAAPRAREVQAPEEAPFRYPGPRPQTREAAIVMLADAAEAAFRSLESPSPEETARMVDGIVNRICLDRQLDECDMTLRDLHRAAQAVARVLAGAAHRRVGYPESGKGLACRTP